MTRSEREARRTHAEARRQEIAAQKRKRRSDPQTLVTALKRDCRPQAIGGSVTQHSRLLAAIPQPVTITSEFRALLSIVAERAPKLLEPVHVLALYRLASVTWERSPSWWSPTGKGRDALFRDLCMHLVAHYPMPAVLWSALFEESGAVLAPVVSRVARGGGLFDAVQTDLLPVPLTRQMCHALMTSSGLPFVAAMRNSQVRAFGGDQRLLQAWMATDVGRHVHDRPAEEFWATVLRWFCRHPLLDRLQVGPLVDFIASRRQQDPAFEMKGRSPLAMLRGMREWHRNLARLREIEGIAFRPCGIPNFEYRTTRRGEPDRVWTIKEILNSVDLAAEGEALNHCVYAYAWAIDRGMTSIWSMRYDSQPKVTIEVRTSNRQIVQARGACNRGLTAAEHAIVARWASENGLAPAYARRP